MASAVPRRCVLGTTREVCRRELSEDAWRIDRRNQKLRARPPPSSGRKTNGSGGSPTPPWLWLLLLGGFALIFWQFVPKTEIQVVYYPWFYDQVQADNIKSITIQGDEIRGELRKEQIYENTATQTKQKVTKFITNAPPEPSLAIVQKLIQLDEAKKTAAAKTATDEKKPDGRRQDRSHPRQLGQQSGLDLVSFADLRGPGVLLSDDEKGSRSV